MSLASKYEERNTEYTETGTQPQASQPTRDAATETDRPPARTYAEAATSTTATTPSPDTKGKVKEPQE